MRASVMTSYETLAVAYFIIVALTGWSSAHRRRALLYSVGAVLLVIVARFLPWPLRAWIPHAYLVLGYWIPAAFTPAPRSDRFEGWLARVDDRLRFLGNWKLAVGSLELAYLLCYPLVPAAFFTIWMFGGAGDVDRFWMAVLLAGYSCYVTLPWTAARPPRLKHTHVGGGVAALNALVLRRFSHNLITFPSGHVAVSMAAALAVARVSPAAGVLFGMMALMIAIAAVTGRYHYRVDVLTGALVGLLAWIATG